MNGMSITDAFEVLKHLFSIIDSSADQLPSANAVRSPPGNKERTQHLQFMLEIVTDKLKS